MALGLVKIIKNFFVLIINFLICFFLIFFDYEFKLNGYGIGFAMFVTPILNIFFITLLIKNDYIKRAVLSFFIMFVLLVAQYISVDLCGDDGSILFVVVVSPIFTILPLTLYSIFMLFKNYYNKRKKQ